MQDIALGQRWISEAEPELGLGLVVGVDARTVTLMFPASDETRTYSRREPPVSRVRFDIGERIRSADEVRITIDSVDDVDGILIYTGTADDGNAAMIPETRLDHRMRLTRALDRLLAGLIDPARQFSLRHSAHQWRAKLATSPARGLLGARVDLISHQLYLAHEVGTRMAPRVLLADEVGLGKTIEAGLILHSQAVRGRADRILVVVPEALIHQWFVEMWRRFQLRFSIYDEERCASADADGVNPFQAEQRVLASLDFLTDNPNRLEQALDAGWDMLVVDEAHHLRWAPDAVSPAYAAIEQLASVARGVLLLTATPEQLGRAGHFARLRLLDPHRFHDLGAFLAEEDAYQPIAEAANALIAEQELSEAQSSLLADLAEDITDDQGGIDPDELLSRLIDRHGTGRVLFRNTRAAMKGFPKRELVPHELSPSDDTSLTPEYGIPDWTDSDPRVDWLAGMLADIHPRKALVICAHADTAQALSDVLKTRHGLLTGVFHEHLDLVARDRAAAWFADTHDGARALICSEIGSEGRNFQFVHHLVLFDLPLNPDLLEQRIGRLDRIGQKHDIHIHVPYRPGSAGARMLAWYLDGLDAFHAPCPDAITVFDRLGERLQALLATDDEAAFDSLLADTRTLHAELSEKVKSGRDRLLELNSHRAEVGEELIAAIETLDRDPGLENLMNGIFDAYGVDTEELGTYRWLAKPSERMRDDGFPGLPEEGIAFSVRRSTALAREDEAFLSWEHPMVRDALDLLDQTGLGNSAVTVIRDAKLPAGTLLLEALFRISCTAPASLDLARYIGDAHLRVLVDKTGRDLAPRVPHERLRGQCLFRDRAVAGKLLRSQQDAIRKLYGHADARAGEGMQMRLQSAQQAANDLLGAEIARLQSLRAVNPSVREDEISLLHNHAEAIRSALSAGELQLDALHLIVAT
ncbi:MAG: RNA polymerase-associated protein RapA [Gammaproteobacteria bacterium]|nr:RNA polymerase-associated protein RapA [Gammaproteobacteria bacterium]MCP5136429.1 RNA polymerase-associated protein RapA [Gammaproteobacteria bacterium]